MDQVQSVSAIIAQQTLNTSSQTTIHKNSGRQVGSTKGSATTQSALVTRLSKTETAHRKGTKTLVAGVIIVLIGLLGLNVSKDISTKSGEMMIGIWESSFGLLLLLVGAIRMKKDKTFKARSDAAHLKNRRARFGNYCNRCNLRFDSEGIF